MKINTLLINVSLRPDASYSLFPVGLGYVATAMKNAGFDFDLLDIDAHRFSDDEVVRRIGEKNYDVVCLGCIVTGYKYVKWLCQAIRDIHPQAKIIVGNSVATSITATLLTKTQADVAVIGEGDETVPELLHAIAAKTPWKNIRGIAFLNNGQVCHSQSRPVIKEISKLPFLNFELFDYETYISGSKEYISDPVPIPRESLRALPVNTARGCIANCGFCYHVFKGNPYRTRITESILTEIKYLLPRYSLNYINFWDELTFYSRKQASEFVDAILASGLEFYWTGNCRADLFNDEDDLKIINKMKQAGCLAMNYSLESSSREILKAMNKRISPEQFTRQTELFHKAGLAVYTSLVIGYPEETPQTIHDTFQCCIDNRIYPSAGYLLPQPGSPVYDNAIKSGHIVDEEDYLLRMGDRQDLRINLTAMTDDDFTKHVQDGLRRCNEALKVGLSDGELIKSKYYRANSETGDSAS